MLNSGQDFDSESTERHGRRTRSLSDRGRSNGVDDDDGVGIDSEKVTDWRFRSQGAVHRLLVVSTAFLLTFVRFGSRIRFICYYFSWFYVLNVDGIPMLLPSIPRIYYIYYENRAQGTAD